MGRRKKVATTVRPCMTCKHPFPSEHKFHRICDTCKQSQAYSSPYEPAPGGLPGQLVG